MKTVELYRMINNGKVVRDRYTLESVNRDLAMLEKLGIDVSRFTIESEGLFTYRDIKTAYNSMSQADIDAGGDNEPFELTHRVYTAL
jgi:hypothetical protein